MFQIEYSKEQPLNLPFTRLIHCCYILVYIPASEHWHFSPHDGQRNKFFLAYQNPFYSLTVLMGQVPTNLLMWKQLVDVLCLSPGLDP